MKLKINITEIKGDEFFGEVESELSAELLDALGLSHDHTDRVKVFGWFELEIEDAYEQIGFASIGKVSLEYGDRIVELDPSDCDLDNLSAQIDKLIDWSEVCADREAARADAAYDAWKDSQYD